MELFLIQKKKLIPSLIKRCMTNIHNTILDLEHSLEKEIYSAISLHSIVSADKCSGGEIKPVIEHASREILRLPQVRHVYNTIDFTYFCLHKTYEHFLDAFINIKYKEEVPISHIYNMLELGIGGYFICYITQEMESFSQDQPVYLQVQKRLNDIPSLN